MANFRVFGARWASAAIILMSWVLFASLVQTGMKQGMHRHLPTVPEFHLESAAIAISRLQHDIGWGYITYANVYDAMQAFDYRDPSLRWDHARVNRLFSYAASLPTASVISSGIVGVKTANDLGYADFLTMSFSLFGYQIEAYYYGFFLIFALSLLMMHIQFFRQPAILSLGLSSLIGWAYLISSPISIVASVHDVTTLTDVRVSQCLAIIPFLHVLALAFSRENDGLTRWITLIIQSFIIYLAMSMRYSASWAPTTFVLLAAASICWAAVRSGPPWLGRHGFQVAVPLIVAAALILGLTTVRNRLVVDRWYADYGTIVERVKWHSAYLGLSVDRETWERRKLPDQEAFVTDNNGWKAVKRHFEIQNPATAEKRYNDLYGSFVDAKWQDHERIIRGLFFDYILQKPWKAIYLYVVAKPVATAKAFVDMVWPLRMVDQSKPPGRWRMLWITLSILACLVGFCASARNQRNVALCAGLLILPAAALPSLWAYPLPHSMFDLVVAVPVTFIILAAAMLNLLLPGPPSVGFGLSRNPEPGRLS